MVIIRFYMLPRATLEELVSSRSQLSWNFFLIVMKLVSCAKALHKCLTVKAGGEVLRLQALKSKGSDR